MVSLDSGEAIALLIVGFIAIQGMWLSVLTYLMFRRHQEKEARAPTHAARETYIEEVFLLNRAGLLLRHHTRRLKPHADSDVLTGMLRAVQEFVRDAFLEGTGESTGELDELSFGELKLSVCSGEHVILATVVRGKEPTAIKKEMQAAVLELEADHRETLRGWQGQMDAIGFVDAYLEKLLEGGYRGAEPATPLVPAT